jgi:hypothetical protein
MDNSLTNRIRGLAGISGSGTKYVLMAAGDSDVLVRKGQVVGSFSSVLQLDDQESTSEIVCNIDDLKSQVSLPDLDLDQQAAVFSMLNNYKSVFSSGDLDIGLASVTEHQIKLTDETPIFQRPRRFPQPVADEIERQCQELNSLDVIEPSSSPWSSPVVPVRKKDGSIRMCIDYRQLNRVTIPDKFPVPTLADSVFGLYGTEFFTRLDLVRGYYQIPVDEKSRPYTAFSTPRNHWQFKRLSFGLRNAPSAFQREIQAVLSTFPSSKVIAYIDDILIMGTTFAEHLSLVSKVLHTLRSYNIKIKPAKCDWFKTEVEFLGHLVSRSGIKKTPSYVKKISEYPKPKTVGELREFLGFINFQRKFLPHCSEIQKPLSCLTGGRKSKVLEWTPEMLNAFAHLKREMEHDLELAYPDYREESAKLELWVDASAKGSGAYLAQMQGDSHRIIGFASMTFTPTQLNYSTLERELTALRWGVKTFRPFLYGVPFTLYTDHQPLVHLHNMKIICSRLARTVEELSDFVFDIVYVPGHLNSAADALSRIGLASPPAEVAGDSLLPQGLVVDGCPAAGGGDSLFVSLLRGLSRTNLKRGLPKSHVELRALLVDELLNNSSRYKLDLDRSSRKELRLMRQAGQLPSLDLLVVASRLFEVQIFVYFWATQPVIYQFDNFPTIIHLQCISGIHFNPLIEINGYSPPDVDRCDVNCVQSGKQAVSAAESLDADSGSETDDLTKSLLTIDHSRTICNHPISSLPQVWISIADHDLCAVLDSGAEISLVSVSALELACKLDAGISRKHENLCDIVGFSGKLTPITQSVEMSFAIGSYKMKQAHKFAVVDDTVLPHCFLLGIDFMNCHNISIDLRQMTCKQNSSVISQLTPKSHQDIISRLVLSVGVHEPGSGGVIGNQDLRFEIEGDMPTITGLSLLTDEVVLRRLQTGCPVLRSLCSHLSRKVAPKAWPRKLKQFVRHASKLSILNEVIVYGAVPCTPVVPFHCLVEVVVTLHSNLAHIGRDKLLNLLSKLVWHPEHYKTIQDVCNSCHQCQIFKEFSTAIVPPTIKICTSYPFELVAADLVSLPRTSSGFVGCLVVVDHYSKWVAAVPIKNKASVTIINAFSKQVFPFLPRVPVKLLTDNGPEFSSREFSDFLVSFNVKHKLTTPYCPRSNGAIERVNRTIQNFLRNLVDGQSSWDAVLHKALIIYNSTSHSELKMSPSNFLLTKVHQINNDPPLQGDLAANWKLGHPKFSQFDIGQLVLYKIQHRGFQNVNKLTPKFKGPFKVTRVNDNGVTYDLSHLTTDQVIRAHHSQLRSYRQPPKYLVDHPAYSCLSAEPHGMPLVVEGGVDDEVDRSSTDDNPSLVHRNNIIPPSNDGSTSSAGGDSTSSSESSSACAISDFSFIGRSSRSPDESFSSFLGFTSPVSNKGASPVCNNIIMQNSFNCSNLSSSSHVSALSRGHGLCRGCHYEATLEARCSHIGESGTFAVVGELDTPVDADVNVLPDPVHAELYNQVFDWVDQADSSFQLESLHSSLLIDKSHETTDLDVVAGSELEAAGQSDRVQADSIQMEITEQMPVDEVILREVPTPTESLLDDDENAFEGFCTEPVPVPDLPKLLSKRKRLSIRNTPARRAAIHTRSRGSAVELPNVQAKILERASGRRRRKSS